MTATTPQHPLRQDCQKVRQILARIGEKWSMLVVMLLRDGPRRFKAEHLRFYLSDWVERLTGARLFEFRNYELV